MNYELKHFNTTLVRFSATEDTAAPDINILWVNEECRDLLPLGMELNGSGIAKWLKQRTIPKNRAYVNSFLSKCGLHINRPFRLTIVIGLWKKALTELLKNITFMITVSVSF